MQLYLKNWLSPELLYELRLIRCETFIRCACLQVVGLGKCLEALQELESALEGENGTFHAKQCDITVESDILETFKWIEDTLGPISILINNASILKPTSLKGKFSTIKFDDEAVHLYLK